MDRYLSGSSCILLKTSFFDRKCYRNSWRKDSRENHHRAGLWFLQSIVTLKGNWMWQQYRVTKLIDYYVSVQHFIPKMWIYWMPLMSRILFLNGSNSTCYKVYYLWVRVSYLSFSRMIPSICPYANGIHRSYAFPSLKPINMVFPTFAHSWPNWIHSTVNTMDMWMAIFSFLTLSWMFWNSSNRIKMLVKSD